MYTRDPAQHDQLTPPPAISQTANVALLTEANLSARWQIPPKTLRNWRSLRKGPPWVQIGAGHVRYRLTDILAFETSNLFGGRA